MPQGSILSPLLFNLHLAGCGLTLDGGCHIVQFVDDIALYVRSSDLVSSRRSLGASASALSAFLCDKGLSVSLLKSALMIFTKRRIDPANYSTFY